MTGLDAMKQAVEFWHLSANIQAWDLENYSITSAPRFIIKLEHVIYRLNREIFKPATMQWEYEGF